MKRLAMTNFSLKHPWWVMIAVLTGLFLLGSQFPKVHFDNDPENMLSEHEHVRVFHNLVKETFSLYDFVIVGIVNTNDADGVFNVDTLSKVYDLTSQLSSLHQAAEGQPAVITPARGDRPAETVLLDLHPEGVRARILAKAFHQDRTRLFDEEGRNAIIVPEIISLSAVDNIKQAERGQLKIEYLMEQPPTTREEALQIRDDAMGNPLYEGTLVSEDGQAVCIYLPILEKSYSYNVANLVAALTEDWGDEDQVYITGLPVAEDTFGTEMLVQMATSAPLAGLAIFLLLLFFFRRFSLAFAPMVLAVVTVVYTMGALIGQGFSVHIMSSMIAIFLMPIAVADSVHVLSEFFDTYRRFNNKADTVRYVIGHLFTPMLFTSLTTIAGFASLGLTPIPPVRIFGLHVALGVGLAWVLTMTLIPACIMLWVSEDSLQKRLPADASGPKHKGRLEPFLMWLGVFSGRRFRGILAVTLLLIGVAGFGISKIQVNDNPVKWFTSGHRIRIADAVLNQHFGGTYTAYLTLAAEESDTPRFQDVLPTLREAARTRFAKVRPEALNRFLAALEAEAGKTDSLGDALTALAEAAGPIDEQAVTSWNELADTINYLDPAGLTAVSLEAAIGGVAGAAESDRALLLEELRQPDGTVSGAELQERALDIADRYTGLSFRDFVFDMEAELTAPAFKRPEVLHALTDLQDFLEAMPRVGKTSSAADALKKAAYELNFEAPAGDVAPDALTALTARNQSYYDIPPTPSAVAQVYTQLEGMKKKDSLFHLVTRDYRQANVWVQLTSGDNSDMEGVVSEVKAYVDAHPLPANLEIGWAGLTYINVVWQDKMVVGMLESLGSSFVVVLLMMIFLFRSPLYGVLAMIPLSVTIALIYGIIGLVGKDYDMPVAVLSALTLGLSVDFAIHFLQRAREIVKKTGSWEKSLPEMFKEPAMAISRNAIIISIGFTPLLVAPLAPYKTVGFFLATIMAVSWLATLFLLAALATLLQRFLFKQTDAIKEDAS